MTAVMVTSNVWVSISIKFVNISTAYKMKSLAAAQGNHVETIRTDVTNVLKKI